MNQQNLVRKFVPPDSPRPNTGRIQAPRAQAKAAGLFHALPLQRKVHGPSVWRKASIRPHQGRFQAPPNRPEIGPEPAPKPAGKGSYPQIFPDLIARFAVFTGAAGGLPIL